jgi:glyoxylase-like metal-dependent hydrolase (beta-lactamase superfamily II)
LISFFVWQVAKTHMDYQIIPVTPFQQNCTLLWDSNTLEAAVVDPGGDIDKVLKVVKEKGLNLKTILLTHGHLDHVGGTAELVADMALPVIGPHMGDKFWIDALEQQCSMFGFPKVEDFQPDQWLEEGQTVKVGSESLEVVWLPGHTPGHVAFVHHPSKLVLVGDVLFKGSIGRTDFPQGNHAQLIESIQQKLLPIGDDYAFIPGHGPMSTLGEERQTNPFISGRFG